jgi:hypothetical protein
MIAGWLALLCVLAVWQLLPCPQFEDIAPMAFWTGLFAFLAWAMIVLPLLALCPGAPLLHAPRWSWAGWMLFAIGSYTLLVATWLGWSAFKIIWYPAGMGLVAGFVFGRLRRSSHGQK